MEAGGSRRSATTRKRKSAALKGEGSPAPAPAAAPDPGAADHDGGGDGRDLHLSDLPDDVLRKIISVLPMKQRGRTQILAKRWLPLWRSLPLNIDCGEIARSNHGKLGDVLQRIISSHQGDCQRFCIRPLLATNMENDAAVDACLLSPALNKLKELEFYRRPWHNWQRLPAPTSIFRFSPTLCVAQFGHCTLTDDIVQGLHFPQLKKLGLDYVFLSEFSLSSMIAGSPSLEVLLIIRCSGARCLRINSFTLRSIEVGNSSPDPSMEELIIESAPHLERLFHLDQNQDLHVSVLSAPKLESLGCCTNSTRLVFGSTDIHQGPRIAIGSLSTAPCRIKSLHLCMRTLCLDMVIELMRCFPCLEKLYIQCEKSGTKNLWRRKHRDLHRSFDIRLKKIVLDCYRAKKPDIDFVTFFVLNATVLESMTVLVKRNDEEFLAKQRQKLLLESKASDGAEINFVLKVDANPGTYYSISL
ncbi:hypothetical protein CFC21_076156 [Triticum aestivum]|uniref:F-box domain-containing protein n=2 Tax=Triticum aestivum TaxID=4565 RepID=A0A9R1HRG0_WHEAT|nr:F-box protein At4g09920-like [Triticum aestivum]XP_044400942.1 F-box protein At4g09920-like [Triticum aestivum]KAF7070677.1 hypothetical protein CFC21_076156 [Triticum aestivum]